MKIAIAVGMMALLVPAAHGEVYFEMASSGCLSWPLPLVKMIDVSINAWAPNGMTGAEFAVDGVIQSGVIVLEVTPNPNASAEGDPFGDGGRITFAECQVGDHVPLFSAKILAFTTAVMFRWTPISTSPPGDSAATAWGCRGRRAAEA